MSEQNKGYIYILTNPSFPDYVKIGYADDVVSRVKHLNQTECTPYAFRIYATYEVESRLTDMKLHAMIDKLNPELRSRDEIDGKRESVSFILYPRKTLIKFLKQWLKFMGQRVN